MAESLLMQPLDLIGAAAWDRAVFTTYALSLSFFEAVALDRLIRGGGRSALILADPEGIRSGLSEQGARRAGRDYELEPIASTRGVFHPKLSLFFADRDAHMLVGSGNLTFGGWGMNLETVDHLHPSFAAEAFDDAADMFDSLSIAEHIRSGVDDQFEPIAGRLRLAARDMPRKGNFRLLHSVGTAIADQLAALADDLGGATRLIIVSPYFDSNGGAVSKLATRLRCEDVRLHVHPAGPVKGLMGTNWPAGSNAAPVQINDPFGDDDRKLHAKCFEIQCRHGRLVMAGSANATHAALFGGNVEASLVRIERETTVGWISHPVPKPPVIPIDAEDAGGEGEERIGILRGVLEGDRILGQVVVPQLQGEARLSVATTTGYSELGSIVIDKDGRFEVAAPDLEMQSWSGGRMVLRLEQGSKVAEGFVSVAAAMRIMQKAGQLAPRLLAMLSGTETPEDVAAILTWFKEDPSRIVSAMPSGGSQGGKTDRPATWVSIEQLKAAGTLQSPHGTDGAGEAGWQRALALVRSAFTRPRGPWKSGTTEDDQAEDEEDRENEADRLKRLKREEDAKQRALKALDGLLDEMLADRHEGRHVASAFALTHYLVDRVRPAPVLASKWLSRILASYGQYHLPLDPAVATAGILLRYTDGQEGAAGRARRFMLQADIDPDLLTLDSAAVPGFIDVLGSGWNANGALAEIRLARTPGEEIRAYLEAAETGQQLVQLPILQKSPYWPKLANALRDGTVKSRLLIIDRFQRSCPKCFSVLPTSAQEELRRTGATSHCRIVLCREL